jgi:hypothetical protein
MSLYSVAASDINLTCPSGTATYGSSAAYLALAPLPMVTVVKYNAGGTSSTSSPPRILQGLDPAGNDNVTVSGGGSISVSINNKDSAVYVTDLLSEWGATIPPYSLIGPTTPASNTTAWFLNVRKFIDQINVEYCHYYKAYAAALNNMALATSAGSNISSENQKVLVILNLRLNVMLFLMQKISINFDAAYNTYYSESGSQASSLNSLNTRLQSVKADLIRNSTKIKQNEEDNDIRSSMIDYSLEKNSSSRNMLAVYGFMNIIAGGLLFYIYTKSRS